MRTQFGAASSRNHQLSSLERWIGLRTDQDYAANPHCQTPNQMSINVGSSEAPAIWRIGLHTKVIAALIAFVIARPPVQIRTPTLSSLQQTKRSRCFCLFLAVVVQASRFGSRVCCFRAQSSCLDWRLAVHQISPKCLSPAWFCGFRLFPKKCAHLTQLSSFVISANLWK